MLYKEDQIAKGNVYFVMYGLQEFQSSKLDESKHKDGIFGEILNIGWILGEEILYHNSET